MALGYLLSHIALVLRCRVVEGLGVVVRANPLLFSSQLSVSSGWLSARKHETGFLNLADTP